MTSPQNPKIKPLPALIFSARWLQVPLYLGLIAAQGVYVVLFVKELWYLVFGAFDLNEQQVMLIVLGLIDVVMISNLLIMVIVGGYETFVSRLGIEGHQDQPEWLSHVNATVLKVKLALAIIGISSIHLLKTFIEAGTMGALPLCSTVAAGLRCTNITEASVMWQTIIHVVFILSALGIAWTDRVMGGAAGVMNGKSRAEHWPKPLE
ncbi:MAG: TIGR00645 family protein [Immundisolibacter sp.]|uniref:TIGR00645 family protein n=1 Tax=Immundisolibacter sp. TaxID=1934948 RepID=UPI003EE18B89